MGTPFPFPVVAPGGALVIPSIHSPNFQAGVSGWDVNQDGSAEFNNLTIRGTFNGTDFVINASGAFFYSSTPAANNLVASIAPAAGTDSFGNAYPAGIMDQTAGGALQTVIHDAGIRMTKLSGVSAPPIITLLDSTLPSTGTTVKTGGILTPLIQSIQPATAGTAEQWHSLTPVNGWSNAGGSNATLQYRLVASPPSSVEVIGVITETAKTSNVFGTLPSGYRPASIQGFGAGVSASGGTATTNAAYIQCDASGNLSALGFAGGTTSLTFFIHGFISLDA